MRCLLDLSGEQHTVETLYLHLSFPPAPPDRPYVFLNMVSSLDGKITLGNVGDSAAGLGSPIDQLLMRRIQRNAQAVIIGANTLRAGHVTYPPDLWRVVVTASGTVPENAPFFAEAPGKAWIVAPTSISEEVKRKLQAVGKLLLCGEKQVCLREALHHLRQQAGIERLLCEGGGILNYEMFAQGLIDEWFLTLAPKVKGGRDIPTPVEGAGLPREAVVQMQLVSVYEHDNELYLRYRRAG